jgi:hypothetical protein
MQAVALSKGLSSLGSLLPSSSIDRSRAWTTTSQLIPTTCGWTRSTPPRKLDALKAFEKLHLRFHWWGSGARTSQAPSKGMARRSFRTLGSRMAALPGAVKVLATAIRTLVFIACRENFIFPYPVALVPLKHGFLALPPEDQVPLHSRLVADTPGHRRPCITPDVYSLFSPAGTEGHCRCGGGGDDGGAGGGAAGGSGSSELQTPTSGARWRLEEGGTEAHSALNVVLVSPQASNSCYSNAAHSTAGHPYHGARGAPRPTVVV